ncbi:MAG: amidohydrolase [Anaerolineae bacterium]
MRSDLSAMAWELEDQLIAWRRDIHAHPELGFEEHRTARLVSDALRDMGLAVETGVGRTGVVGRLGEGPPAIGLRADMDALPIQEANEVTYASQVPGVMHACGHDAHVAMLLGAAQLLTRLQDDLPGEVRFLFQPSEEDCDAEGKSGAPRMIEDGALEGLGAVLALHVDSAARAGTVGVRSGYIAAAVDFFSATIIGAGCHSAFPHEGISPIAILAQVIHAVQNIRALRIDPLKPAIIAIEHVRSGEGAGVIPDKAHINGNIRSYDEDVRRQLHCELERALSLARVSGGDYCLTIDSYSPATYNDPAIAKVIAGVVREIGGPEAVFQPEPRMYGEDFSTMARRVPGVMAFLGVRAGDEDRPLHSPFFDLDESALPLGVAVLAGSAIRLLNAPS